MRQLSQNSLASHWLFIICMKKVNYQCCHFWLESTSTYFWFFLVFLFRVSFLGFFGIKRKPPIYPSPISDQKYLSLFLYLDLKSWKKIICQHIEHSKEAQAAAAVLVLLRPEVTDHLRFEKKIIVHHLAVLS